MKTVNLVYYKSKQTENWNVSRVYALRHTARSYASKLRKRGFEAFVLERTVRTKNNKGN